MLEQPYIDRLQKKIREYFPKEKNRVFIFGSALRKDDFRDVDIAIEGVKLVDTFELKESLEETTLPFFVDIVPFDEARPEFQQYVLKHEEKQWI